MRVVSAEEMKAIEKVAMEEIGFSESLIVENVGLRGADFLEEVILGEINWNEIVLLVGRGNNGADALAIGRHLVSRGHKVRAFMLFPDEATTSEVKTQMKLAAGFGVKLTEVKNIDQLTSYFGQTASEHLVIDGVIGTGFRLPLSQYLFEVFNLVNEYATVTIAIDIPSGVECEHGEVSSVAIRADYTLAIGLPKTGHYIGSGAQHSGEVVVLDAGLPSKLLNGGNTFLLSPEEVTSYYDGRDRFAHKNTFGHALVVGGSHGLCGALMMASSAALKVGTGLVTAATWSRSYGELVSRIPPEIMTGLIPVQKEDVEGILKNFDRYDTVVVGPGMGRSDDTRRVVLEILNHYAGPVIVDADAIKVLSLKDDHEVFRRRKAPTILTPHMGEFAQFSGQDVADVIAKPLFHLRELVDQTNSCIVMKGAATYMGFPNGEVYINYFPNDGMASGGSGDVLAGIIGGVLAQLPDERRSSQMFEDKTRYYNAICAAVAAHTLAGKIARDALGARAMTAMSIVDHLSHAFKQLDQEGAR